MFLFPELLTTLVLSGGLPSPTGAERAPASVTQTLRTVAVPPRPAQSPAPAAAAEAPRTGPLSGYMELHYNEPIGVTPGILDLHRFVLLVSHRFSDRIRFVGEIEVEHALVEGGEEGGELEIEQAYLDFMVRPSFNIRAGMLLVPVGIINERHEPPVFHGVERPFVDTVIIPTTWFEAGTGVTGSFGRGFRYRAYVMAPLDATEFSANEGLRGGAQQGSEAIVRNVALTGRLEYVGIRGLQTGVSFWTGKTGFAVPTVNSATRLFEMDARFSRARLETRAQYAHVFNSAAGDLNDAMTQLTGINPNVAEQLRGFYLEGAYRVLPSNFPHDAALFVRYENFDTQYRMPAGFVKLPQFDRDAWVVGGTYWVDPDVAIKVDYSHTRSQSLAVPAPRTFNIGLGWWF